jgi:uncharacterized Zn-finger protein
MKYAKKEGKIELQSFISSGSKDFLNELCERNSAMSANPAMNSPEIIRVDADTDSVSCDGGGGPLGHPKVWYSFDGKDRAECGYCDRLFVKS